MPTTRHPARSADREYKAKREEIDFKLSLIAEQLHESMDAQQAFDSKNWGYLGDMNRLDDLLEDALAIAVG